MIASGAFSTQASQSIGDRPTQAKQEPDIGWFDRAARNCRLKFGRNRNTADFFDPDFAKRLVVTFSVLVAIGYTVKSSIFQIDDPDRVTKVAQIFQNPEYHICAAIMATRQRRRWINEDYFQNLSIRIQVTCRICQLGLTWFLLRAAFSCVA